MIPAPSAAEMPLPRLREDLRLVEGPPRVDGAKSWLIYDPVANRYYEIGIEVHAALAIWPRCERVGDLIARLRAATGIDCSPDDVQGIVRFLEDSSLLLEASGGWRSYAARAARAKPGLIGWLIHNYLYIQIPLLRPHALLLRLVPLFEFAFKKGFYAAIALVSVAGLYLASRQWDEFMGSFAPLMTLQGASLFAIALAFVKVLHEFGHAITAARFGCRVPTMGIAVVVMLPMLYTDVTDAWKLPRQKRMLIDAAGVIVELMLAGLSTFAWAFIPDGLVREIVFIIATTSWIMSIGVNLNPLMRFDGYFLISDWSGISNLQSRSNALGRWRLREILFRIGEPPPERLPKQTERWITTYAWIIWCYRLVVFTGIALTVYHYFFKVLGIILFAVEIGWFVIAPILREIAYWWKTRDRIHTTRRSRMTFAVASLILLALVTPWSTHITVPVVRDNAVYARLFPIRSAEIKSVLAVQGQSVKAGDVLFELVDQRLAQDLRVAELKLGLLRTRLGRRIADRQDRAESISIDREIASLLDQKAGLERQQRELVVKAPIDGIVAELDPDLVPGRWISRTEELALVAAPDHGAIYMGYVTHDDLPRIKEGSTGRFLPEDPLAMAEPVVVADVAYSGSAAIDIPYLASTYGGPVQVLEDRQRGLVPQDAAYLVTMKPSAPGTGLAQVRRGVISLEGKAESLLAGFFRRTINVLIRESGA